MLSRRSFLVSLGAGIGGLAVAPRLRAAETAEQKPNIILFMVDDMGWQDTSVAFWYRDGKPVRTRLNERYETPNMQAMADAGMLFTDAYACAVCSPTRCSLMSGMNMARHRVTDWTLGVDQANRLTSNGEGCYPPVWAVNGLQPENTAKSGRCNVPWKCEGFVANQAGGTFRRGDEQEYTLNHPFTNALAFPKLLQEAGYYTIHCGKAHWGSGSTNWNTGAGASSPGADPLNFGFDVNIAGSEVGGLTNYRNDSWFGNANGFNQMDIPDLSEYYGKTNAELTYYPTDAEGNRLRTETDRVFLTDALTDKALRTVDAHLAADPNTPFYLYMAHYAVHTPLGNGEAWDESRSSNQTVGSDTENPNPDDGLTWNDTNRNYAVLLKGMDDSLGTIRKFLETKGIADNTVVIFMADNGGLDGSANSARFGWANAPLRAGKGSCYEGGTREPLMVVWPGHVTPGSVCHEPVHIDDFYPTILDIAGIPLPAAERLAVTPEGVYADGPVRQVLDGQSFKKLLADPQATVNEDGSPRTFLWHYPNRWGEGGEGSSYHFYTAVRKGEWKLIYQHNNTNGTPTFELYNLTTDISESLNLAERRPDLVDALRREMAALMRERGAQMPTRGGLTVPYPDDPSLFPMAGTTLRGASAAL